ncbi:MAG: hypothetical protein ACI831_001425, partial [Candidatus Azotimanducaceae bacterium]
FPDTPTYLLSSFFPIIGTGYCCEAYLVERFESEAY